MIKITTLQAIATALLGCGLSAAPAQALPNRTWVSGTGTDSGTCTRPAPCRTFNFALSVTNAGGEIDVLDPAGYGGMTITKAISIVNDGVGVAGIGARLSNGITITAGATDSVHLRGLTILGLGTGTNGILFTAGGNLAIENCVIRGFTTAGINISPSTSSSFSVSNTIASNNVGGNGIFVFNNLVGGIVTGILSKVTASNNSTGIDVEASTISSGTPINVTIVDSVASNNTAFGVNALLGPGTTATNLVIVRNSIASYNGTGLAAGANSILRVAHSVVTGNVTGVSATGSGILDSYGDNDIDGNTTNIAGTLNVILPH